MQIDMVTRIDKYWNILRYWPSYAFALWRFRDYKPQQVSIKSIIKWVNQFEYRDRKSILGLLHKVIYISEGDAEKYLVKLNERLLERLSQESITLKKVIYVQLHDPGSSSPVMLNLLRDRGRLERKGCHFIDSKNVRELNEVTSQLEQGAIIYVDDFAGTGRQFCEVRDYLAEYIVGNFAEFFLLPCICEEALYELGKRGVEAVSGLVHSKAERPLHLNSTILDNTTRARLTELCRKIDKHGGLGYGDLATMVVLYRNAPNTVPLILRGCMKQNPWVGLLPRTTDLP